MWMALAGVWAATFIYPYTPLDGEILCVWRRITTLNCPGCGLTRSFCAMSQLEIVEAFAFHPVGPLLYGALVWTILAPVGRRVRASPDSFRLSNRTVRGYWIIAGVVFAIHFAATVGSWIDS